MNRFADLDKRIQEKDIFMLREALGNTIYGCRDFSDGEFDDAVRYVESKGIKIKDDELKGELVSTGKIVYTPNDFADAIAELKMNFCDERINDVKKIGKALYGKNKKPVEPSKSAQDTPNKRNKQDQGIVKLIKDLLKDLWGLLKSLGSRNFSVIRSKWQQLCRNAANNARRTAFGKKLSKILNKTPKTAEDAKEQINEIKNEMQNINEAVCLIEAAYLYEEYQTDSSSAFQQNEPESKTPYVHRVEYNWYDPNLMDLKRLPSDEDQDSVTEPS